MVSEHLAEIDARDINSIPIGGSDSGIVVRVGRYGPYVQRSVDGTDERASLPEDLAPDELTVDKAVSLLEAGSSDRELGVDPATGDVVVVKAGRYGPYVSASPPPDSEAPEKSRTASLFRTMDPASVTLADALQLLQLPRQVGVDPADGAEIEATNGRYGPYLRKGSDSRSLDSEDQLFTVSLEEALAIFAQPKTRRGRGAAAPPLRDLGADPASGAPMLLKEGRFGPYVTDGTTNASLRKGDTVDGLTVERAAELLADRRAAPPRPGKKAAGARKATGVKKAARGSSGSAGGAKKAARGSSGSAGGAKKAAKKKAAPRKRAGD
jgi:DNA topoisomerase-1